MHHQVAIPGFDDSWLFATDGPEVDTAAFFIHGFLGNSLATWQQFTSLVNDDASWRTVDLFFLQYDSFRSSTTKAAERVLEFVDSALLLAERLRVWSPEGTLDLLSDLFEPLYIRDARPNYTNLLLIGHSLGGLVLREAVVKIAQRYLQAASEATGEVSRPPMLTAKLRLFSPAIMGARPAGLKGFLLRFGGVGHLAGAMLGSSPSYLEVQPGSTLLGATRDDTLSHAQALDGSSAFSADVLWADSENVVLDKEYRIDRSHKRVLGTDHVSVCKPRFGHLAPLAFALKARVPP